MKIFQQEQIFTQPKINVGQLPSPCLPPPRWHCLTETNIPCSCHSQVDLDNSQDA